MHSRPVVVRKLLRSVTRMLRTARERFANISGQIRRNFCGLQPFLPLLASCGISNFGKVEAVYWFDPTLSTNVTN
jgi:hypothetical protein